MLRMDEELTKELVRLEEEMKRLQARLARGLAALAPDKPPAGSSLAQALARTADLRAKIALARDKLDARARRRLGAPNG
jgi:hypothetical protein